MASRVRAAGAKAEDERPGVFLLRGHPVMLATAVAKAFGVETREVNQAAARNPRKFSAEHTFQLRDDETRFLRSQGVIPKRGRGGSPALPRVFTQKGVARLATVITSPEALRATDLIIDLFVEVYQQIAAGRTTVTVDNSWRLSPEPEDGKRVRSLRRKVFEAMEQLLDTVVDTGQQTTLRDELEQVGGEVWNHLKERLRTRELENEKLAAETALILEQARALRDRTRAEIKKSSAEAERLHLENFELKLSLFERSLDFLDRFEPTAVVELFEDFGSTAALAGASPRAIERQTKGKKGT